LKKAKKSYDITAHLATVATP